MSEPKPFAKHEGQVHLISHNPAEHMLTRFKSWNPLRHSGEISAGITYRISSLQLLEHTGLLKIGSRVLGSHDRSVWWRRATLIFGKLA